MRTKKMLDRRENLNMRYIVEGIIGTARVINITHAAKLGVRYNIPLKIIHRVLVEYPQWKTQKKHIERRSLS